MSSARPEPKELALRPGTEVTTGLPRQRTEEPIPPPAHPPVADAREGEPPAPPRLRAGKEEEAPPAGRIRPARVTVGGVAVDPLTERRVVEHVAAELAAGRGGHIVTPNIDICRTVARDPELRRLVGQAELVVADGMPLVWASKLIGTPVPQRVTGADLIWSLSKMAARRGWPVYLLGGPPGVAARAAGELQSCYPSLKVCGIDSPPYGFDTTPCGRGNVRRKVVKAAPAVVFVGLGFPRQDQLIADLRKDLPAAWFIGCGSAIAFAAGAAARAPEWMQSAGLEWLFRLLSEPGRLARRYLVDDLSFAARLLAGCLLTRFRKR